LQCLVRRRQQLAQFVVIWRAVDCDRELDAPTADQACGYVRDTIESRGGAVMLDLACLSCCDARGLGALAPMSRYAGQAGSSLHLVAPQPLLVEIIRVTGLDGKLPVHRGDRAGQAALARPCHRSPEPTTKRGESPGVARGFSAGSRRFGARYAGFQQVRMVGCAGPARLRQVMRERLELPT
jgi:anti-anti-sigma factor